MTRTLTSKQIEKRRAIRLEHDATPGLSVRALAVRFNTSPRVVSDALHQHGTWDHLPSARLALTPPTIPPEALVPRGYQVAAAGASVARNTLLVLPTGLGKTVVALLHVRAILSSAKAGICLMMAPTKALLVQHRDLFRRSLSIPDTGLAIVDGETAPDNRRLFYKSLAGRRAVLFMTPQTVLHDLEKGRLPRDAIIDLVVDEAHHATKGDPYALVHGYLREHGVHPRVLAMTASPGETEARIVEVCQGLGIRPGDAIIKDRDDPDVREHVFKLDIKKYAVALTPDYVTVRALLLALLREPLAWLMDAGVVGRGKGTTSIPTIESLGALYERLVPGKGARAAIHGDASGGQDGVDGIEGIDGINGIDSIDGIDDMDGTSPPSDAATGAASGAAREQVISRLVMALKARHCVGLVETQGFAPLLAYHEKQVEKARDEGSESAAALLAQPAYKRAVAHAAELAAGGSPRAHHPKLDVLEGVLARFVKGHPSSRCIVFTKYRASIPMLVSHLSTVGEVVARRFVGQGDSGRGDKGMGRDEQQAVLRAFKAGEFNVLVATKAAEEGIDVADCDMVAFYEATASVIQFIQRQGRAGRRRDGNVAILQAQGTSDQLNDGMLREKLAAMPGIYYRVQRIRAPGVPEPRPASITRVAPGVDGRAPVPKPRSSPSSSHPSPVLVRPGCWGQAGLLAGLTGNGVPVKLDAGIPGEVALPNGVGVRVINEDDAEVYDLELAREELPGVARPVVAIVGAMGSKLKQALARGGVAAWECASVAELAARVARAAAPATS